MLTSEFNPVVISASDTHFYLQNDPSVSNITLPVYPIMNNINNNYPQNTEQQRESERVAKIIKAKLHRYLDMSKEITLLLSVNNDYTLFKITSGTYVTFKLSNTKQKSGIITSYGILINNDVSDTNIYSLSTCTRNNDNGKIYNFIQCMLSIHTIETFADRKESFYQLAMQHQIKKMEINLRMLKHRDNIIKSVNKYDQFNFMFKEGYTGKQLTPLLNVLFLKIPTAEQRTSMISINISANDNSVLNTNDTYQSKISYITYHIPSKSHYSVDGYKIPLYQHTINYGNLCFSKDNSNVNYKPIKCECVLNELSLGTVVFSFKTFEPIGIICYSDTNSNSKYMLSFEHPALLLMLYTFIEDDDNKNVNDDIININEFIRTKKVIKEKRTDIIENNHIQDNNYSKSNCKHKSLFVIHKQNRYINVHVPSSNNKHLTNKNIKTHPLKTFITYKVIQPTEHTHNNKANSNNNSTQALNQPKFKYIQKLFPLSTTASQTYTNTKRYRSHS